MGRNEKGEWGLALGTTAQLSVVDLVGMSFFPTLQGGGPDDLLPLPPTHGVGRAPISGDYLSEGSHNREIQRL